MYCQSSHQSKAEMCVWHVKYGKFRVEAEELQSSHCGEVWRIQDFWRTLQRLLFRVKPLCNLLGKDVSLSCMSTSSASILSTLSYFHKNVQKIVSNLVSVAHDCALKFTNLYDVQSTWNRSLEKEGFF